MTDWRIPVKTEFMREQSAHEPSMKYAQDIYKVASRLKGFSALEIGAAWGFSTLAILEAGAKSLLSVDSNTLIKAPAEVEANGYSDKYAWTCCRSDKFWEENQGIRFDLIYVDGSHLLKDIRIDLKEAWKRLNKGGMLLLDDWDHLKNVKPEGDTTEYGVSLACLEFWRDHVKEVEDIGIEGRVLWFKK